MTHARTHTLGKTPLEKGSARRRDLKHKSQTSMPPVGYEPANPSFKRLQTYMLDRVATRIGTVVISLG
jgi:hypothetical protein